MSDFDPIAAFAAAGNGDLIPSNDGGNEASTTIAKPKKRPQRSCQTEGCKNKTAAADGICKECKPAVNKKKAKKAVKTAAEDVEEDDTRSRTNSIFRTPEPNAGLSGQMQPPATPASLQARSSRPSVWDQPESSASPQPDASAYPTPGTFKTEDDIQEQETGTPTPADRNTLQPVIEISTSPRKRDFEEADLSNAEDEEGDIADDDSRKQRKLSPTPEQQNADHDADVDSNQSQIYQPSLTPEHTLKSSSADESAAVKSFHNAFATSAKSGEDQLKEFKKAQKEQYDAMEASRITQTDAMTTAKNDFIAQFEAVQQDRDFFKGELGDLQGRYALLESELKVTEEERDGWMSEKEIVERQKEQVETQRDEWKVLKEQLDEEKAEMEKERDQWMASTKELDEEKVLLEEAKEKAEKEAEEEIHKLKEKVEKLKKAKADWIKSLIASDSD